MQTRAPTGMHGEILCTQRRSIECSIFLSKLDKEVLYLLRVASKSVENLFFLLCIYGGNLIVFKLEYLRDEARPLLYREGAARHSDRIHDKGL